jgi:hypothetical protein
MAGTVSTATSPEALEEMTVKVRGDRDELRRIYADLRDRIKVAQEAGNTSTLELLLKSETELLKGICLQQRASLRACVCHDVGGRCASLLCVLYVSCCFTPPMKRATTNRGHSRNPSIASCHLTSQVLIVAVTATGNTSNDASNSNDLVAGGEGEGDKGGYIPSSMCATFVYQYVQVT